MKRIILLAVFLLSALCMVAEKHGQEKIDSLLKELPKMKEDTNKVKVLNEISILYSSSEPKNGIKYAEKAIDLSSKINYKLGEARAYNSIGSCYKQLSDYNNAINNYSESINICIKNNFEKVMLGAIINLANIYIRQSMYSKAEKQINKVINTAKSIKDTLSLASAYNSLGNINLYRSEFQMSIEFYKKAAFYFDKINHKKGESSAIGNIGIIFYRQAKFHEAIEYFLKSLRIMEEIQDKAEIAKSLIFLANVYTELMELEKAEEYFLKSLEINKVIGNKKEIYYCLSGLANIYKSKNDYRKAIDLYKECNDILYELNDLYSLGMNSFNLASAYAEISDYENGLKYSYLTLELAEKTENKYIIAQVYSTLGLLYFDISQDSVFNSIEKNSKYISSNKRITIDKAIKYIRKSISMNNEIGDINKSQKFLLNLSTVYTRIGDYQKALIAFKEHISLRDSIFNEETQTKIANLKAKRENDLMIKDMEKLKIENQLQESRTYYLSAVSGLALLAIIIGFFFYRNKRRTNRWLFAKNKVIQEANTELDTLNKDLAEKNQQIVHANIELDSLNKDLADKNYVISEANENITASIEYASRIQTAMLPFAVRMQAILKDYFVLFLPKDIVSGDFYWIEKIEGKTIIIVGDCTGHGVPGAFMSMIGNELLNNIVIKQKIYDPSKVLAEMHKDVRYALKQDEASSSTHDGMDVCICVIEDKKLTFAGAKRPLYYVQNSEFHEIKGDRKSIGGRQKEEERVFTNHEIDLTTETMLYLTTDGYQDQHNTKQEKFGVKRFRELLQSIADKPMQEQKEILAKTLEEFSEGEKNRDDVAVLGVRV